MSSGPRRLPFPSPSRGGPLFCQLSVMVTWAPGAPGRRFHRLGLTVNGGVVVLMGFKTLARPWVVDQISKGQARDALDWCAWALC